MARVFKHICSAYGCNQTAKYRREIDETLFKFCESHKYCLNHARAENIINMVKGSSIRKASMAGMFNTEICGFSDGVINETVRVLVDEKYLSTKDGYLILYKDATTCLFPGCTFKKTTHTYCQSHSNLPPHRIIKAILAMIGVDAKSASAISEESGLPAQVTSSVLKKLTRTGYVSVSRNGIVNHYSAK